jgi:signal transduction histidine kinase
MVSHELKTPVTSIKGYVQTLLMMLDDEEETISPEQIKSSLVRMDKQVLNLTRLISEMLDLTRIEAGILQFKMELFSLNTLINETAGDILIGQPKYNIELFHDCYVSIFADRDRIGQVLINFINNAIKYSPTKNKIEIHIYKTGNGKVSVSVKDFGIGISKDEQQKIFERFYRVGGSNEQTFPGFGIGLFIASSIILKHHGTISINSEKGKGSEFIFELNIAQENN